MAFLEAASVHAFCRLSNELVTLGAPTDLIQRAARAAKDERRHARLMTSLARSHGGRRRAVRIEPSTPRQLFEIATENEVEGVVRETYSALVAHFQAKFSRSSEVRRIMTQIAVDEMNHAKLAWDVRAWILPRLTPSERRSLARARSQAFVDLAHEVNADLPEIWRWSAGLPSGEQARALVQTLQAHSEALALAA
jgi:hypothetical protein